jgi:hypothetical protein
LVRHLWLVATVFALTFGFFAAQRVIAAAFTMEKWRGHKVLRLSGVINEGTADEFKQLIKSVPALPHGLPVLLLDSDGGLVSEALAMSVAMGAYPTHTVIPAGAKCASACASIVFVAGTNRTVEEGGALGQHSCSIGGKPDQNCNDRIADHAVAHGVSHGSIAAFVTYVAPEDILWFSREDAEGWGLTRYPGEAESGFEKSEPRVLRMLTGKMPAAQSAWRLNFREDGYEAFSRTVSDVEREMEIGLFCVEALRGRLFMSMLVHGPVEVVADAALGVGVRAGGFKWEDTSPVIWQADASTTEVITEVPRNRIVDLLTRADTLTFGIATRKPYDPIVGRTSLASSRAVLKFAANHCVSGEYPAARPPLQ